MANTLGLGASHMDVGQLPEETHVVLGDPEGNELCVIPPDSSFLAGGGVLGEVACDGTRAVGIFWSKALAWPLGWDQNDETAIHRRTAAPRSPGAAHRSLRSRFQLASGSS